MDLHRKFRSSLAAVKLAGVAMLLSSASFASSDDATAIRAVWKDQEIEFTYTGGSIYTCSAIEQKIRSILLELESLTKPEVRVQGCVEGFRSKTVRIGARQESGTLVVDEVSYPHITIAVTTLFEATPAVMRDLAERRGEQDLKARLRPAGDVETDYSVPLPAERKLVRLNGRTKYLDPGDCDLIEQVRTQVLPKLDVRAVTNSNTCNRRNFSLRLGQHNVTFETLVPKTAEPEPLE
jgi:hypothetical protein